MARGHDSSFARMVRTATRILHGTLPSRNTRGEQALSHASWLVPDKRRNRKLTLDQHAPDLPTGFPQERGRRRLTTAWTCELCRSLPIAFFGEGDCSFLITYVRLQSPSFIGQTADSSSGDVILFRNFG
jgi:hypothetical protein